MLPKFFCFVFLEICSNKKFENYSPYYNYITYYYTLRKSAFEKKIFVCLFFNFFCKVFFIVFIFCVKIFYTQKYLVNFSPLFYLLVYYHHTMYWNINVYRQALFPRFFPSKLLWQRKNKQGLPVQINASIYSVIIIILNWRNDYLNHCSWNTWPCWFYNNLTKIWMNKYLGIGCIWVTASIYICT